MNRPAVRGGPNDNEYLDHQSSEPEMMLVGGWQ